jgi:hypothetical protein
MLLILGVWARVPCFAASSSISSISTRIRPLRVRGCCGEVSETTAPTSAFTLEMWLVTYQDLKETRRVRLLFDFLRKSLREHCAGTGKGLHTVIVT